MPIIDDRMSDTKKKAQSAWITKDRDEGRCAFHQ
jgi:hypothetical protein